jgi:type I restriction enzyme, S subunit
MDAVIRRYIDAKRKLIMILDEQKQAIVHRVITRGLNPDVRLKHSGVEWLGDVPAHWEVQRNGRLFAQRNETGYPDLPILEVSLRTGIRIRDFAASDRKQVISDRAQYKRAAKGDIAYNMMRMWQGAVDVVPVDGLVSPAYVVARPLQGADGRYFGNLFRTSAYMSEVDKYSRGIVKDRNRLYWEDFKQMASPCPPLREQVQIADAIEQETRGVKSAMGHIRCECDLIREYRTRLIADVVTGKLDVRAAAAALPEASEEPEDLEAAAAHELEDTGEDEPTSEAATGVDEAA